jgi:hypothetical protein
MWVWQSIRPGVIQRPSSLTVFAASQPVGRPLSGPTKAILPSLDATAPAHLAEAGGLRVKGGNPGVAPDCVETHTEANGLSGAAHFARGPEMTI